MNIKKFNWFEVKISRVNSNQNGKNQQQIGGLKQERGWKPWKPRHFKKALLQVCFVEMLGVHFWEERTLAINNKNSDFITKVLNNTTTCSSGKALSSCAAGSNSSKHSCDRFSHCFSTNLLTVSLLEPRNLRGPQSTAITNFIITLLHIITSNPSKISLSFSSFAERISP